MGFPKPLLRIFPVILVFAILSARFYLVQAKEITSTIGQLSASEIEEEIQQCSFVQKLNSHKLATAPQTSSISSRIFAVLFPGNPAINALLATLYISGPPNFLLALCPPNIDPSSLSVMVAFAVGGLLGDTLFHLLPEIFLGESSPEHARFVLVEPKKNLLLGLAIMVGFITFVALDKSLRIATAGSGGHSHGHSEGKPKDEKLGSGLEIATATGSSESSFDSSVRSRKGPSNSNSTTATRSNPLETHTDVSPSIRLSAYLNLIADFTHNITDGLALSSSFYASPTLGATTTVAVFFHEIPHEVGDFALLIQSGFSKQQAISSQFITSAGAFLGTCLGIAVQELGKSKQAVNESGVNKSAGLAGSGLGWGDLLLPFTAGTFLYVGTVAVVPNLLETGEDTHKELTKTGKQFLALAAGAGIMLLISWT